MNKTKVTNNSKDVKQNARKACINALRDVGYAVLADASNLVPHDTGELENSGDIEVNEDKLEVTIFFDKRYAIRQHEDLSLNHPNGRRAKYLETPLKQRANDLTTYLTNEIKKELA